MATSVFTCLGHHAVGPHPLQRVALTRKSWVAEKSVQSLLGSRYQPVCRSCAGKAHDVGFYNSAVLLPLFTHQHVFRSTKDSYNVRCPSTRACGRPDNPGRGPDLFDAKICSGPESSGPASLLPLLSLFSNHLSIHRPMYSLLVLYRRQLRQRLALSERPLPAPSRGRRHPSRNARLEGHV